MWQIRRRRLRRIWRYACATTSVGLRPTRTCSRRSALIAATETGPRGVDQLGRLLAIRVALDLDVLALRLLVDREEVLDLGAQLGRDVVEVLELAPVGVLVGDADDL